MKEEFCTYEIAKKLKELKFSEPCLGHYQDNVEMFTHKQINGILNLGFLGQCKSEPYDWNNTPKWGVASQIFYSAPLWQQAIDWLRIYHDVLVNYVSNYNGVHLFMVATPNNDFFTIEVEHIQNSVYLKGKEEAILFAIQFIENKNNDTIQHS